LPVLRRTAGPPAAHARPRGAARTGRPLGVGECGLSLLRLQPSQGRPHARPGQHGIAEPAAPAALRRIRAARRAGAPQRMAEVRLLIYDLRLLLDTPIVNRKSQNRKSIRVASSNSRTPALQAGGPGAEPGRSTSLALSATG